MTEKLVPPVKEGDVLKEQLVISEGKKNDGVIKYENYIIFVENCKKDEVIDINITNVLPSFGIGKRI